MSAKKTNQTKKNDDAKPTLEDNINKLDVLKDEIVDEAIKITKNEISSCYTLVQKTKELLNLQDVVDIQSE